MNIPSIDFQPENYNTLLSDKAKGIRTLFNIFNPPQLDVFPSPKTHFRMRSEFRIWHEKKPITNNNFSMSGNSNHCFYAMFEPTSPKIPVQIKKFPIAHTSIDNLMAPLLEYINKSVELNKKLFQIEFLSSTKNEVVATLIYHRMLDDVWEIAAKDLEKKFNIHIIGRARKQKIVLSKDYVNEVLNIDNTLYNYEQKENSFTQPNAAINQAMIQWCASYLSTQNKKNNNLLEMYCGNGNFTIPLSCFFNRVLATEISKSSIASAKKNCERNNVDNIDFVRLSGEETASALNGERIYRRLKDINISEGYSAVFVDPPRSGLDQKTLDFIKQFETILYISCNPNTLYSNIEVLVKTHKIERFALFDQFPYTPHCECGVILNKRP